MTATVGSPATTSHVKTCSSTGTMEDAVAAIPPVSEPPLTGGESLPCGLHLLITTDSLPTKANESPSSALDPMSGVGSWFDISSGPAKPHVDHRSRPSAGNTVHSRSNQELEQIAIHATSTQHSIINNRSLFTPHASSTVANNISHFSQIRQPDFSHRRPTQRSFKATWPDGSAVSSSSTSQPFEEHKKAVFGFGETSRSRAPEFSTNGIDVWQPLLPTERLVPAFSPLSPALSHETHITAEVMQLKKEEDNVDLERLIRTMSTNGDPNDVVFQQSFGAMCMTSDRAYVDEARHGILSHRGPTAQVADAPLPPTLVNGRIWHSGSDREITSRDIDRASATAGAGVERIGTVSNDTRPVKRKARREALPRLSLEPTDGEYLAFIALKHVTSCPK